MAASAAATPSASVRAYVRGAWRTLALRRAIEAVLIGMAALVACLAASVASGADVHVHAWVVSCAVGCLGASSWWLEHWPTEASVAHKLDGDGALVTAYECEVRGIRSPLQALLSRRVARDLTASGRRVARMPSALILAALLAAGALFALAVESGPRFAPRLDARRQVFATSARALVTAADEATSAQAPVGADEVRELAREAAALAATPATPPKLADFAVRAEQVAIERVGDARVRQALAQAATAARELSAALVETAANESRPGAGDRAGSADGRSGWDGRAPGGGIGPASTAAGRGSGAVVVGDPGTDMPDGPPDVTMSRPDPGPAPDPVAGAPTERGLPAVRWWPRRFDAVVERWVEHQRTFSDR